MIHYPVKTEILRILAQHKNRWLKAKTIAKEMNHITVEGINRVSVLLYRLRNFPNIERKRNSRAYQYRYFEEVKEHPTNILPIPKTQTIKKAKAGRDKPFVFVEWIEPKEGFCDLCERYETVTYRAERENTVLFLCDKCGRKADKQTGGYAEACFND